MAKTYSRSTNQPNSPNDRPMGNLADIFAKPTPSSTTHQDIEKLIVALGVARAFSNIPDVKKLIQKIQHKLFGLKFMLQNKIDPSTIAALGAVNASDVQGLMNCIAYFNVGISPTLKQLVPGQNKASSLMRLACLESQQVQAVTKELANQDSNYSVINDFISHLTHLLQVLERKELQFANMEEDHWD